MMKIFEKNRSIVLVVFLTLELVSIQSWGFLGLYVRTRADEKIGPWCEENNGTWAERIAQWGLKAKIAVLKTEIFGFDIGAGYKFSVKPAFTDGLFTRMDRYYFDIGISKDLYEAFDGDFTAGPGIKKDYQLTYFRHFSNACQAELALPYADSELPFTAKRARKKLSVGDYITWKSGLGVVVSADFLRELGVAAPFEQLSASVQYELRGSYQIHLLKFDKDKVRLRLVGLNDSGYDARAGVGYGGVFEIFGVRVVDRQLTRIADLNPVRLSFDSKLTEIFAVEYTMDLSDPEVADLYDRLLSHTRAVTRTIPNPWKTIKDIQKEMIVEIKDAEVFSHRENQKKLMDWSYKPKMLRTLKGKLNSDHWSFGTRLSAIFAKFKYSRGCGKDKMHLISRSDEDSHYRVDSCNVNQKSELFFHWGDETVNESIDLVFFSDSLYHDLLGINFVFPVVVQDKRFTYEDYEDLKTKIRHLLPKNLYDRVPFDEKWHQSKDELLNSVGAGYRMILSPTILEYMPSMTRKEVFARFDKYLSTFPSRELWPAMEAKRKEMEGLSVRERHYGIAMNKIAYSVSVMLDRNEKEPVRVNAFLSLHKIKLFRMVGLRFIFSLLDPNVDLQDFIRFELQMTSLEGRRLEYSIGYAELDPAYVDVQSLRSIIRDDGIDILKVSEELKQRELVNEGSRTSGPDGLNVSALDKNQN